ncbi:MAG: peroxidase family protein [Acidimicrobiales bacterium]
MLTTDLAMRMDPVYRPIAKALARAPRRGWPKAFAKAWYKLLHRDMGPVSRYLGPWVPEAQLWQDPVPAVDHPLIGEAEIADLKQRLLGCGLSGSRLVATAWASASTFRGTDKRGGANGARIRFEPQRSWEVNEPGELATALQAIERVQ